MDRYSNIGINPTQQALHDRKSTPERSKFNLSRIVEQNLEIGRIHVIDCIETLPNDTFTSLGYIMSLQSRNPTLKRALTGMRVYVHAHYQRLYDIWEGAQNFIDSGNSGKIALQIPTLETVVDIGDNKQLNLATPMSLLDELDVPAIKYVSSRSRLQYGFGALLDDGEKNYGDNKINALPYAMYQQIYLTRYANRNMLQSNKNWVPDNQMHFRLPYEAVKVAKLSYDDPQGYDPADLTGNALISGEDTYINPNGRLVVPQDDETNVYIAMPRYRLRKGDYFTQGLPFSQLIRGDVPTIDLTSVIGSIDWSDVVLSGSSEDQTHSLLTVDVLSDKLGVLNVNGISSTPSSNMQFGKSSNEGIGFINIPNSASGFKTSDLNNIHLANALSKAKVNATMKANIDMATLNALEAMTIFRQRMALTNGRYNEMVEAQYGYNPEAPTNDPMYIGGFYFDITGQDIIQQSESGTTPLGNKAGRLDSGNSGYIPQFHAKDFGYIIVTLSIMPDSNYNSGLPRWTTRIRQDETYFPIFNNLAPQAILNKEIFYSGDDEVDNDLFAWTERYSDYKQRQNRVRGLMAIENLEDSSYTMQNWYDTTPTLNNKFLVQSQENTDYGIFTTTEEPPFVMTCAQHVEVVRAMPYVTMPAGLRGGRQ